MWSPGVWLSRASLILHLHRFLARLFLASNRLRAVCTCCHAPAWLGHAQQPAHSAHAQTAKQQHNKRQRPDGSSTTRHAWSPGRDGEQCQCERGWDTTDQLLSPRAVLRLYRLVARLLLGVPRLCPLRLYRDAATWIDHAQSFANGDHAQKELTRFFMTSGPGWLTGAFIAKNPSKFARISHSLPYNYLAAGASNLNSPLEEKGRLQIVSY